MDQIVIVSNVRLLVHSVRWPAVLTTLLYSLTPHLTGHRSKHSPDFPPGEQTGSGSGSGSALPAWQWWPDSRENTKFALQTGQRTEEKLPEETGEKIKLASKGRG